MPKKQTGLTRRKSSNNYQFEIRIPADLAELHAGKRSHRVSLGTTDQREATLRASQLSAQWQALFAEQRARLGASAPVDIVTPDMARAFAQQTLHGLLGDERERTKLTERRRLMPALLGIGMVGMQGAAEQLGIAITTETPGAREATAVYIDQLGKTLLAPGYVPQPEAPTLSNAKVRRLRDVFKQWKLSVGVTRDAGTVRAKELALEDYEAFSGNPPLSEIKREHGQRFKAWLLAKEDRSSKWKHQRLVDVKTLLKFAAQELEWIPKHPWASIDIEFSTEKPRTVWSVLQLSALLSQPLFTKYELPHLAKAGADAGYWIPLLALFNGARLAELCQLKLVDVEAKEGIWGIDINTEDGKRLKSQASHRWVPIHSELVRLGFLEYVEAMRESGHESLWPAMHLREGKPSHGFSWWFNNYPRRAVKDMALPDFHSFRHTVRTKLMKAGISDKIRDAITGHETKGSAGTVVYEHVDLEDLTRAIAAIAYPGLTLQKTYERPSVTKPPTP